MAQEMPNVFGATCKIILDNDVSSGMSLNEVKMELCSIKN